MGVPHSWASRRCSSTSRTSRCRSSARRRRNRASASRHCCSASATALSRARWSCAAAAALPPARSRGRCIGDLGWLDPEGYLYLADRRTDMILSGGANIYPAEVEGIIDSFQGVRSSAVIGLPNDDLGNVVHAIIDAPLGLNAKELLQHLAERLVRYKIPRSIELVTELLRDEAGKVRRKQLRESRVGQTFPSLD